MCACRHAFAVPKTAGDKFEPDQTEILPGVAFKGKTLLFTRVAKWSDMTVCVAGEVTRGNGSLSELCCGQLDFVLVYLRTFQLLSKGLLQFKR